VQTTPDLSATARPAAARGCPVCGSSDERRVLAEARIDPAQLDAFAFASRKVPEHMHHRLVECPVCDTVYASPLPDAAEVAEGYAEAAYDSREEAVAASRTYARLLHRIPDRRRAAALDIGAGDGAFLERLLEQGYEQVAGFEPSRAAADAALPDVRPLIRLEPFTAGAWPDESLDLVTCFQTLEHVFDPLELCRQARRLLRPGGALLVVTHDRRAATARMMGKRSPIFDIEHLQLFSQRSLAALLARAGLTSIQVWPIVNRYPVHYWAKLAPVPRSAKPRLLAGLKAARIGYAPVPLRAGNIAGLAIRPDVARGSDAA
jgi:SAM-dependent methyltransferase